MKTKWAGLISSSLQVHSTPPFIFVQPFLFELLEMLRRRIVNLEFKKKNPSWRSDISEEILNS